MNEATALCPVCAYDKRRFEVEHEGMRLHRCLDCGSVFMDPPPSLAVRHEMYDDPYKGATAGYYLKRDKKMRRLRKRARMLDALVQPGTGRAFLEVGSSGGFMVECMRELGYAATGVEPDGPGVAYARENFPQATFHHGFLEAVEDQLEQYDAIYCSEVIEHVPEPQPFFAAIARHLKPGGVVNVTTPDVDHWNKPKDITRWNEFCPPSHCVYFTPKGLKHLFEINEVEVIRHRFNWKAGIQLYGRKA